MNGLQSIAESGEDHFFFTPLIYQMSLGVFAPQIIHEVHFKIKTEISERDVAKAFCAKIKSPSNFTFHHNTVNHDFCIISVVIRNDDFYDGEIERIQLHRSVDIDIQSADDRQLCASSLIKLLKLFKVSALNGKRTLDIFNY